MTTLMAAPPSAPAPADGCEGKLRGEVIDQSTAEPLARVRVTASESGELRVEAETDDAGRFVLDGLCAGRLELRAERADYEPGATSVRADGMTATHVDLTLRPREVDRLDDVVVVAPAATPAQAGAARVIDGAALERTRGRNLADAIAEVPGVTVLRGPAGGLGKPIIRGQFGRRNLILFDRVRHESQKWGIDHAPEVDPFAAGSITVIRGPAALRHGGDAVGGVVLIDPRPLREFGGYDGEVHAVGVSNGLRGSVAARVDGAHEVGGLPGGRVAWRADGNVTRGAAQFSPDYALDNTGVFNWNAGARLGYLSDRLDVVASYRRHFMKAGVFTGLRNETQAEFEQALESGRPAGVEDYEVRYAINRPFSQVSHDLAIGRARVDLGGRGDLVTTYAFQFDDRSEWDVVRASVSGPQLEFDLATHSAEMAFEQRTLPLGSRWSLAGTSGVVMGRQRNDYRAPETLIPDYGQWTWGVFAVQRFLGRRVDVELGARYDGMDRTARLIERDVQGQVGAGRLPADACATLAGGDARCDTGYHAPSGSVALVGHLLDGLDLTLSASSTARFPNIDELYMNGEAPSFPVLGLGRGTLGPERTWATDLTVSFARDWVATEASVYFNYIDDYIYFAPSPGDGPLGVVDTIKGPKLVFTFEPVDALFWGFEYGVDFAPPEWPVSFDADVSLVRAQDTAGDYLVFVPADRYGLGARFWWSRLVGDRDESEGRIRDGFIGVDGDFVAQQVRFDPSADFSDPPPGYVLLGAEAGLTVPLARDAQALDVALSGQNLTNARYRDYTSLLRYYADEPGWSLTLRITWRWDAAN